VQAFKKGPDYIDAGWLAAASGRACYNLDGFLMGQARVLPAFLQRCQGADLALIEGNRGLFDGMDLRGSQSTSRLARLLRAPVLLVLDATKMTRTAAALLRGAKGFERGLRLAAVVLNNVAGARHEALLRASIEQYAGIKVLGALPKLGAVVMPERHMGLTPTMEHRQAEKAIRKIAGIIRASVDMEALLRLAKAAPALQGKGLGLKEGSFQGLRVGVLRDSAFQFYYPDNLEALKLLGARLQVLSPLRAKALPQMDALYIGGGFPETHAVSLSVNKAFLKALRRAIEAGLPVYAECGGLMYLGRYIRLAGRRYRMASVLPYDFVLKARPVAHGYSMAQVVGENPFYPVGTVLRGHEFHYSHPLQVAPLEGLSLALRMVRGQGLGGGLDGLVYKGVFATYTHVHALGSPGWARGLLRAAQRFRRSQR
jgi:cobyrinic acid a,c-diamide synthase